jgi:hypothetical protein
VEADTIRFGRDRTLQDADEDNDRNNSPLIRSSQDKDIVACVDT